MGRLPFDQIDVLIVGELGRSTVEPGWTRTSSAGNGWKRCPISPSVITRLAVLDLSVETRGNALGIGLADLTTDRFVKAIDPVPMRVNSLTSNFLTRARVPLSLPTDRDVIAACLQTCWRAQPDEARLVLVPNTLELTSLWVTRPLAVDVEAHAELSFETDFQAMPLNAAGNLEQERLFPDSVRGRRSHAGDYLGNGSSAAQAGVIEERAEERVEYKMCARAPAVQSLPDEDDHRPCLSRFALRFLTWTD